MGRCLDGLRFPLILLNVVVMFWMITLNSKAGLPMPSDCRIFSGNETSINTRISQFEAAKLVGRDPRMVHLVRDIIEPPAGRHSVLKIHGTRLVKTPQAAAVDKILRRKGNGFFLECGAFDGETSSNTIFLERTRNWKGLLVEMDPHFYTQLKGKNRKAHILNACLSPVDHLMQLPYKEDGGQLGKLELYNESHSSTVTAPSKVPCFPLETMLLALNRTSLDYLSLDVEGLEMELIQSIPFDRLNIRVMSVEHKHVSIGKEALRAYIEKQGYTMYKDIHYADGPKLIYVDDFIFVKKRHRAKDVIG